MTASTTLKGQKRRDAVEAAARNAENRRIKEAAAVFTGRLARGRRVGRG